MGIDIYARWPGQTEAEADAQCTGYSIAHGHIGYLREAYHGEPYATRVLVPEAHSPAATTRSNRGFELSPRVLSSKMGGPA